MVKTLALSAVATGHGIWVEDHHEAMRDGDNVKTFNVKCKLPKHLCIQA
jgi:hypothetical protein